MFEGMSINVVLASHLEDLEDMQCDDSFFEDDINPWIRQLNALWDICFKQREPPTDDKLVQIDLGDGKAPKPIFINLLKEKTSLNSFEPTLMSSHGTTRTCLGWTLK